MPLKVITNYVKSDNLDRVGHQGSTLYISFKKGGGVYAYANVHYTKFRELLVAESAGKFLHAMIKPFHTFTKLDYDPFDKPPTSALPPATP